MVCIILGHLFTHLLQLNYRDRVVCHLGHSAKGAVYSGQFRDIKEALIYMLDKPGFNFPLRSGTEIPQPTTTLPYPQAVAKAAKASASAMVPVPPSNVQSSVRFEAPTRPASTDSSDKSFATACGDASDKLQVGELRDGLCDMVPYS